jgi:hypothetical protein
VTSAVTLFSPLDEALKLVDHYCSPAMISQALRIGAEIPSYRRAANLFSELSQVPLSKSTLQRMSQEYGGMVDAQRNEEAAEMVRVPSREEEVQWREVPEPDSPMMNVSSDGVMIHLRDEGWKEVKMVAISAVEAMIDDTTGAVDVQLAHHSYRAGLWEAKEFANHLWAESCHRGLEKATQVTSVNDGALWIWSIVWMCFARCIQILDWWHAVQYLWTIAGVVFAGDQTAATRWVEAQKRFLAQSNLRQVMRNVRLLFPRGEPLPDPVLKAVTYLFRNRWRMCYREFRAAGCPIGSGTVESACKLVVQQRMKQAAPNGYPRWSRNGAQAMLALGCLLGAALLSDRWDSVELVISHA